MTLSRCLIGAVVFGISCAAAFGLFGLLTAPDKPGAPKATEPLFVVLLLGLFFALATVNYMMLRWVSGV